MKVVIVYESLTGNTKRAAELMGGLLAERGVDTTVCPITGIDHQALALADLVVVGGWVDGLFFVGQRPGRAARFEAFPPIDGKRCLVYCTYAIDPGKTLEKLTRIMQRRGAQVLGGMTIKRSRLEQGAREFVDRLLQAVPA
ncbi:flavodoxin family protein [Rhabdothermincola sp.]|uniref:flavodoxin family protein n=1 Tax=Rhabdothermincola sp. TaxID=2820405 RepID=UPI002FE0CDD9